uniref:Uncharacterized protein n=1 Tax=Aegilops tauschii subsp. strangulata TaxID=200361 RepID=A0A453K960_AEGTS
ADNEPVDPKNYLEERCKPQCVKSLYDYEDVRAKQDSLMD